MKQIIMNRLQDLSSELESTTEEKKSLLKKLEDIEVRLHQLVGAIYELQMILNQADQLSQSSEAPHK